MPRVIITDKLRSYAAAKREILPGVEHRQSRYLNDRAEVSHQPTRRRERQMGLRRMSDLETPEADMMRDHSSVEAAPATLRAEESQPGLDPNNPGAASDTTRGRQHLAGLGRPVSDPLWDEAE